MEGAVADSVKARIIARLLEIAQPLLGDGKFRVIERASAPFLTVAVKPALHLVIGDEHRIEEDNRGYTLQFPATWDLIVQDARDPYALADESVTFLQRAMEKDPQLTNSDAAGLCNAMIYDGELPYTSELTKPVGGTLVMYLLQYRRAIGEPETGY